MINNAISGGQVFLHKVRMFSQIFANATKISLIIAIIITIAIHYNNSLKIDWWGFLSYKKAQIALNWDRTIAGFNNNDSGNITLIDATSKRKTWHNIDPYKVVRISQFKAANLQGMKFLENMFVYSAIIFLALFIVILMIWSIWGNRLSAEKKKGGSGEVLTATQVKRRLRNLKKSSDFKIGEMPLVKDTETQHILVTGATGSGKSNLIHNILPQVIAKKQPALVLDQTGEMIAKYYDASRGDIIFNPFDKRSKSWDFWADCSNLKDQKKFAKILMGFNRKLGGGGNDRFWENAATDVFNAIIEYARAHDKLIEDIAYMACHFGVRDLKNKLKNSKAAPHLSDDSKQTAASIISVMATNAEPITYLRSNSSNGSFSMKQYFADVKQGSDAWLFLATEPSSRDLTLPLLACLTELALTRLVNIGIDRNRRIWTVIDELPALGRLPSLSFLMSEGRKYGAAVIAGMQSINQLFERYGERAGSTIFGQFGTSFFFRTTEETISRMISARCGTETIIRHNKNTSFGADSLRDGVSYSEHLQKKNLVEQSDLAKLKIGESIVTLPEPEVAICKMQVPEAKLPEKNIGFIESEIEDSFEKMAEIDRVDEDDDRKVMVKSKGEKQKNYKKQGVKVKDSNNNITSKKVNIDTAQEIPDEKTEEDSPELMASV